MWTTALHFCFLMSNNNLCRWQICNSLSYNPSGTPFQGKQILSASNIHLLRPHTVLPVGHILQFTPAFRTARRKRKSVLFERREGTCIPWKTVTRSCSPEESSETEHWAAAADQVSQPNVCSFPINGFLFEWRSDRLRDPN